MQGSEKNFKETVIAELISPLEQREKYGIIRFWLCNWCDRCYDDINFSKDYYAMNLSSFQFQITQCCWTRDTYYDSITRYVGKIEFIFRTNLQKQLCAKQ